MFLSSSRGLRGFMIESDVLTPVGARAFEAWHIEQLRVGPLRRSLDASWPVL